jgi:maltose-binding protein MalE
MKIEFVEKKNKYKVKIGKEYKSAGDTAEVPDDQGNNLIKAGYAKNLDVTASAEQKAPTANNDKKGGNK